MRQSSYSPTTISCVAKPFLKLYNTILCRMRAYFNFEPRETAVCKCVCARVVMCVSVFNLPLTNPSHSNYVKSFFLTLSKICFLANFKRYHIYRLRLIRQRITGTLYELLLRHITQSWNCARDRNKLSNKGRHISQFIPISSLYRS